MRSKGKFTVTIAQDRFGSWNEALEAAGYDPTSAIALLMKRYSKRFTGLSTS